MSFDKDGCFWEIRGGKVYRDGTLVYDGYPTDQILISSRSRLMVNGRIRSI